MWETTSYCIWCLLSCVCKHGIFVVLLPNFMDLLQRHHSPSINLRQDSSTAEGIFFLASGNILARHTYPSWCSVKYRIDYSIFATALPILRRSFLFNFLFSKDRLPNGSKVDSSCVHAERNVLLSTPSPCLSISHFSKLMESWVTPVVLWNKRAGYLLPEIISREQRTVFWDLWLCAFTPQGYTSFYKAVSKLSSVDSVPEFRKDPRISERVRRMEFEFLFHHRIRRDEIEKWGREACGC